MEANTLLKLLFLSSIFGWGCQTQTKPTTNMTFYIGTYTQQEGHVDGKGDGIYRMTFDPATLELRITDTIRGMTNPSFLALSADRTILYAVNEISPGRFEAYDLRADAFGQRRGAVATGADAACHISLDKNAQLAVVCNYVGGVVCVVPLPMTDQTVPQLIQLSDVQKASPRQEASHPHSSVFSPDGNFVYVADLGTDLVMIYRYDRTQQKLVPAETPFFGMPEGSGPRHMAFAADGKLLYVLNELNNTVAVMQVAENGSLQQRQLLPTLPTAFSGANTTADIHLSKDGRALYASNRGHNSIAVFRVDGAGALQTIGHVDTHGKTPRNFHLTHDGQWLFVSNQDTDTVVLYDLRKGDLPVFVKSIAVNTPVCMVE